MINKDDCHWHWVESRREWKERAVITGNFLTMRIVRKRAKCILARGVNRRGAGVATLSVLCCIANWSRFVRDSIRVRTAANSRLVRVERRSRTMTKMWFAIRGDDGRSLRESRTFIVYSALIALSRVTITALSFSSLVSRLPYTNVCLFRHETSTIVYSANYSCSDILGTFSCCAIELSVDWTWTSSLT